jgi:hypothetical protein
MESLARERGIDLAAADAEITTSLWNEV